MQGLGSSTIKAPAYAFLGCAAIVGMIACATLAGTACSRQQAEPSTRQQANDTSGICGLRCGTDLQCPSTGGGYGQCVGNVNAFSGACVFPQAAACPMCNVSGTFPFCSDSAPCPSGYQCGPLSTCELACDGYSNPCATGFVCDDTSGRCLQPCTQDTDCCTYNQEALGAPDICQPQVGLTTWVCKPGCTAQACDYPYDCVNGRCVPADVSTVPPWNPPPAEDTPGPPDGPPDGGPLCTLGTPLDPNEPPDGC
jgi:hypothetical protein